ncbi:DEAD-box ATP-dependent RNA helicase 1 [Silene latifolia]|uniref:DEAD-box ATP-dependent RNA helicase 1 n=1 Tax=Silene latifolia TaxID=37657 RepID=UPI003D788D43
MAETEIQTQKSEPVLAWMRKPVNINLVDESPIALLPFLDPRLQEALKKMGFSSLFPVQVAVWQETIGPGAFERDLCVDAPTGSGKTLAYALPIVQMLASRSVKCLRALVVLPTRDLAVQVKEVFSALAPAVGLSVGLAVGQSSVSDEISTLIKRPKFEAGFCYDPDDHAIRLESAVDILIATPGRLMDHINTTKGFTLEHLRYLVVDETDRLLREAYQSWLPSVLKLVQSSDEVSAPHVKAFSTAFCDSFRTIRRVGVERGFKGKGNPRLVKMVLSATVTRDPSKLSQLELHHPLFLTTGRYQVPKTLESYKVICGSKDKSLYLVALLQKLKGEKCVIFTSSVKTANRLSSLLNYFDDLQLHTKVYSGAQRQAVRSKTLKAFRKGVVEVLVCSDNFTRGMDVEGVKNVINYDIPLYIKSYIHRAGRTARAGQAGCCFTLLRKTEEPRFKKLLQKAPKSVGSACTVYPLPVESIESLQSAYMSALDRLKESVETEESRKRKFPYKSPKYQATNEGTKAGLTE